MPKQLWEKPLEELVPDPMRRHAEWLKQYYLKQPNSPKKSKKAVMGDSTLDVVCLSEVPPVSGVGLSNKRGSKPRAINRSAGRRSRQRQ